MDALLLSVLEIEKSHKLRAESETLRRQLKQATEELKSQRLENRRIVEQIRNSLEIMPSIYLSK